MSMKKVIVSSLLAFVLAGSAFAQSSELSKWSVGVKGGVNTIRGLKYSATNRFDRPYNAEFGIFAERTFSPLFGMGLEYMYVGNNFDAGKLDGASLTGMDVTSNIHDITVFGSVNLTNLLNRYRTSSKFNAYFNNGYGLGLGSVDGLGSKEDFRPGLAATFGLNLEYNLTAALALGLEGQYRWHSNVDFMPAGSDNETKDFYCANLSIRYKFNGVTNNRNVSIVEFERINSQKDQQQQAIDKILYELARHDEEIKKLQAASGNDSIDGVAIKDIIIGQQYQLEQLTKQLTKARKDLYRHLTQSGELTGETAEYEISSVGFQTGSAKLTKAAYAVLDTLVPSLVQNSAWTLKVTGHTDNVGGEAYNKGLSLRRAEAVKKYLVKKGVVVTRISAEGLGFSKAVACNDNEEGRAKNRRVEVVVNK